MLTLPHLIYALVLGSVYLNASNNAASSGEKHVLMLALLFFRNSTLVQQATYLNLMRNIFCFPIHVGNLPATPSDFFLKYR